MRLTTRAGVSIGALAAAVSMCVVDAPWLYEDNVAAAAIKTTTTTAAAAAALMEVAVKVALAVGQKPKRGPEAVVLLEKDGSSFLRCSVAVSASVASPIFLLAEILMRADLGDGPEHPLEVVIQSSGAATRTRTPLGRRNQPNTVGQIRSLHSA